MSNLSNRAYRADKLQATQPGLINRRPFLTEDEKTVVMARIAHDRGDAIPEILTIKRILFYMQDWKIWEFGILILCNNATVYSFAYFLPLILKGGFGYSLLKTYCLLLPPYLLGAVVCPFSSLRRHWLNNAVVDVCYCLVRRQIPRTRPYHFIQLSNMCDGNVFVRPIRSLLSGLS